MLWVGSHKGSLAGRLTRTAPRSKARDEPGGDLKKLRDDEPVDGVPAPHRTAAEHYLWARFQAGVLHAPISQGTAVAYEIGKEIGIVPRLRTGPQGPPSLGFLR